jgi:hypothetical protein
VYSRLYCKEERTAGCIVLQVGGYSTLCCGEEGAADHTTGRGTAGRTATRNVQQAVLLGGGYCHTAVRRIQKAVLQGRWYSRPYCKEEDTADHTAGRTVQQEVLQVGRYARTYCGEEGTAVPTEG